VSAVIFCTDYWFTRSFRLPRPASPASTSKVENYITHRVTNAVTEGFNSKIQMIKSCARGFRSFENYRVAILFHCGKLHLYP